jgi:aspartate aminotransferase
VTGPQESVAAMQAEFSRRRDYVVERIKDLPEVTCLPPEGAFYAFLNVSKHFGRRLGGHPVVDSTSFCMAALSSVQVALVMGSAFGTEGYVRMSFATDLATLKKGFDALSRFLER